MSIIQVHQLSFTYPGSYVPVFDNLSFHMDSSWRLGLVGRNGRGKTTLLRLLAGELQGKGTIQTPLSFSLFPCPVDEERSALDVMRSIIAPFDQWEEDMQRHLQPGGDLENWGQLEQLYAQQDGYIINELIRREVARMDLDPEQLTRPFATFSPGERTRMMLCALFLKKNNFLLIDEPTNHLDYLGRRKVAEYLHSQTGFLLVSHDRDFLDRSCDHIMALQKQGIRIEQGTYSSYAANKQQQDMADREKNARISKDIGRLKASAAEKRQWSDQVERSKIGQHVHDRGFVGAQSARMMQRAISLQNRIQKQVEEKEGLLKNLEYTAELKLHPLKHRANKLLRLHEITVGYQGVPVLSNFSADIGQGERIAITGKNGAGKSTLLKTLQGILPLMKGRITGPQNIVLSILPQLSDHLAGSPYDYAMQLQLETDFFLTLLRKLDFPREAFDRSMAGYSLGQKKKVLLAASLAQQAHLYLWDEPLNYIDLESREQIENLLVNTDATLVFVEHDQRFVDKVATRVIAL